MHNPNFLTAAYKHRERLHGNDTGTNQSNPLGKLTLRKMNINIPSFLYEQAINFSKLEPTRKWISFWHRLKM
jgi:hypothetical protein